MKRYQAVALDQSGRKYGGTFKAPDEAQARRMLKGQGFRIVSLEEVEPVEVERADSLSVPEGKRILEPVLHENVKDGTSLKALFEAERKKSLGLLRTFLITFSALTFMLAATFLLKLLWNK